MEYEHCCYKLPVFYDTPDEKMYLFNEFRDEMKKTVSKLVWYCTDDIDKGKTNEHPQCSTSGSYKAN